MNSNTPKPFYKSPALWIPLIAIAGFCIGFFSFRLYEKHRLSQSVEHQEKLARMLQLIQDEYVDEVDIDSLFETVYGDLVGGLDPHSVYITAEDLEGVNSELEGSFSGIGISFNMLNDSINVLEVISGGPSQKVGLMPGDRIVTIDDSVASGRKWSSEKVMKLLRGPEGSKVTLGIKRSTAAELLPFEVTRGPIPITSIDAAYMLDKSTGYIKVNKFARNTFDEFFTEAVKLRTKGAEKLVIDLRGNSGGFMEMAVLMANEFLPEGRMIVSTHGRTDAAEQILMSDGNGSLQGMELAVLLDEFSASASEIFAGAIQDHDRGIIVGRRSFGKGLVQHQIDLPGGSAMRLTIARYYTPSGRCIQKPFTHGSDNEDYSLEVMRRYDSGEAFSADSVKVNEHLIFTTDHGRKVYGGGGILPDIFIPNDTTAITSYYLKVLNAGMLQKFAFDYSDANRKQLEKAKSAEEMLAMLPSDDDLLTVFVEYARQRGIPARWYYINISRPLIVNDLKALIARTILGIGAYYEVSGSSDPMVQRALKELDAGTAKPPVKIESRR